MAGAVVGAGDLAMEMLLACQGLHKGTAAAVKVELAVTVCEWRRAGCPRGKWGRSDPDRGSEPRHLKDFLYLAASFAGTCNLWKAATAEMLYLLALGLAFNAEESNPGLDLQKGTDFFWLGLAQLTQRKDDDGVHHVLRAIEEYRSAGLQYDEQTSKQYLGRIVVPPVRNALGAPADLCRRAGHRHIMPEHLNWMLRSMFRASPTGPYDPTLVLWLYRAVRKSQDLPGQTRLTPARRLDALQDLTFFYEAALKQRMGLPSGTLYDVVAEVQKRKSYPVTCRKHWSRCTSFGQRASTCADPDVALAALQQAVPSDGASPAEFAEQVLLVLGLVRNMAHHEMNLESTILNSEYQWVLKRLLAALLLSW